MSIHVNPWKKKSSFLIKKKKKKTKSTFFFSSFGLWATKTHTHTYSLDKFVI